MAFKFLCKLAALMTQFWQGFAGVAGCSAESKLRRLGCYNDTMFARGKNKTTRRSMKDLRMFRMPRQHDELLSFVAHFGARVTNTATRCNLENVVLRAVAASRRDPSLARMLPVFLFRVRDGLKLDELTAKAVARGCASRLGYFLEVASKISSVRTFRPAMATLRQHAHADRPVFFFARTQSHPFEAMLAHENTPDDARRWGLLTGTPLDSFSSYFNKVANL